MRFAVGTAFIAALVVAFGATGTALAKGCGKGTKHHGNPSVTQYVEKIPTACGAKGDHGSASGGTSTPTALPVAVSNQLNRSGSQGKLLKKVSSSNQFGAPPAPRRPTSAESNRLSGRSALGAGVSAVSSGSNGGLIALLVIMAVLALAVAGAAVFRRRAPR